jgi:glycine C-acetyltransferase
MNTNFLQTELENLRDKGLYRSLRRVAGDQGSTLFIDGREVINFSSNNYLGFANHPALRAAAKDAIDRYGCGSGASRLISGNMTLHEELEDKIAELKGTEAALVFNSGFQANTGVIPVLVGEGDVILSDALNHASIIDGCRLSRAKIHVFPHKDVAAADKILTDLAAAPGHKLLVSDGVFSMDGDIAPLPGLVEIAERHGAILMVDDAHSSGVLGRAGRGTVDHFDLHGRVHIQVGTLSKAIGVLGGYVCGSRDLIEFLSARARPFLFSTSHPPAVAASCLAAFDVLENEPGLIEDLWSNTRYWKEALAASGFDTGMSETPITPIMVGEARRAHEFSRGLFDEGLLATGIGFPTVPEGKARVRTIVTATHTRQQLDRAADILRRVAKKMGIL